MTKIKVSATIDPDHLAEAQALVGTENVSFVLGTALVALLEREFEHRWLAAHPDTALPVDVAVDLAALAWEDE